jgi:hypothetical protein
MKWNDLQQLYQQATSRSSQGKEHCLTPETLTQVAMGELPQTERDKVVDHLMACSDCVQEYRALQELERLLEHKVEPQHSPPELHKPVLVKRRVTRSARWPLSFGVIAWRQRWREIAVAVACILVVGLSSYLWWSARPPDDSLRNERGVLAPTMKVEPPDGVVLARPPDRLVWPGYESADGYRATLYDHESTPIWESSQVERTSVSIPESVRKVMQPGGIYYWRIFIVGEFDRRQSGLFQFRLAAEGKKMVSPPAF